MTAPVKEFTGGKEGETIAVEITEVIKGSNN